MNYIADIKLENILIIKPGWIMKKFDVANTNSMNYIEKHEIE